MTDEMPGTATSRSVKADQIAYKYGCFLQPGAFGRVHLVDDPRRNGQESWLTRLGQRRAARAELIVMGVMPHGMVGGEP